MLNPTGIKAGKTGRTIRHVSAGEGTPRSKRQAAALEVARGLTQPVPVAEFIEQSGVSAAIVSAMIKAGLLKEERVRAEVDAMADAVVEKPKDIRLTDEQRAALETIAGGGITLLHGVTGSGKTEVYLQAIKRIVAKGLQAIVLVPEIALTPQAVSRFRARFQRVAVLHSVLSEGDRASQWRITHAGEADVIVGLEQLDGTRTRNLSHSFSWTGMVTKYGASTRQSRCKLKKERWYGPPASTMTGNGKVVRSVTTRLEPNHRSQAATHLL